MSSRKRRFPPSIGAAHSAFFALAALIVKVRRLAVYFEEDYMWTFYWLITSAANHLISWKNGPNLASILPSGAQPVGYGNLIRLVGADQRWQKVAAESGNWACVTQRI